MVLSLEEINLKFFDSINKTLTRLKSDFFLRRQDPFSEMISSNRLFGVLPIVHHFKLYYDYLIDPGIQNAVNTFLDQVVGVGFYITADDEKALKVLQEWFKKSKFKKKFKNCIKDSLITGNGALEKVFGTTMLGKDLFIDIELVDMRIVKGINPDEEDDSIPLEWVQMHLGEENKIPYEDTIHFKLFELSKSFLGIGLFHSLSVPQYEEDGELRSIIDDMRTLRMSFTNIVKKHASPDRLFIYENESEDVITAEALKFKTKRAGDVQFTNKDFIHKELTVDPRSRFERYLDMIQLWYELGTQTPAAKLQTTPGFTEASARAALELVERRIRGIQDDGKTMVEEEMFEPILDERGFDPEEVNAEFHFGQPDMPDFDLNQVITAYNSQNKKGKRLVSREEVRIMLQNSGWPLIDKNDSKKDHKIKKMMIDGVQKYIVKI